MILMYHKVALESPTVWWVTADAFWRQMEQLTRYDVVSLSKYDPANPRQVVITFDGAYENVYTYAFPTLKRFGYPFELFVVGDLVGKDNEFDQPTEPPARFATADQLTSMVQGGGRLQWHTRAHPDLSVLDSGLLGRELSVPSDIRALDPKGFRWFAYPHGRNPQHVIDRVRAVFDGAVSCVDGNETDRYQLNRLTVTNNTSFVKSSVSLIVPSYNYGRFAAEAIESALAQTVPPKEILFIDDCSSDNSVEVAGRYRDRIRIVRNEKNMGIVDNFNKAVSLTSGDYICFLGADNRFRSDYVEQCQRLLDVRPDVGVVYTNVVFFGPRAEVMAVKLGIPPVPYTTNIFLWRLPEFDERTRQLLETGSCIHGSSMYRRSAFEQVGGYQKDGPQEDHNLFRRMVRAGWNAALCPELLLEYRQHSRDQADTKVNEALEVVHLRRENRRLIDERNALAMRLESIEGSLGWFIGKPVERVFSQLFPRRGAVRSGTIRIARAARRIRRDGVIAFLHRVNDEYGFGKGGAHREYMSWIRKAEPSTRELNILRHEAKALSYRPKISIITPVYNPNPYDLTQCLRSVVDQVYGNWEWCLVDGGSDRPHVSKILADFANRDGRIICDRLSKNLGIVGNSNEALKRATGDYVAFLDHDDMLAPFALYEVVKLLNSEPNTDFIYSDEDKMPSSSNKRFAPFFKPEWSPDTFRSYNYLCHFAVVRRSIIEHIGGFREGFDGSQDYDLILRITEVTQKIRRIPKVLYHWRASSSSVASDMTIKPYAYPAAKRALTEHLKKRGSTAEVLDGFALGAYRVRYSVPPFRRVAIIIPTKDQAEILRCCVSSVLSKTNHQPLEVVVVDNQSEDEGAKEVLEAIGQDPRIKVIRYDHPFNFSAINNFAVQSVEAEYIVFLNNDTEIINPGWLSAMLEFAQRQDVGAVGAKLYYPDDTVQHGGVVIGLGGVAGHAFRGFPRASQGYMGRLKIAHNVSAVTAACMMLRRAVFEEVGGFDERLSHAFNDVDLCLRVREKGYLNVFTPYAEVYHHESASRGYDLATPERTARFVKEVEFMKTRWKHVLDAGDPYYNPNLTLEKPDFSLKL